MDFVAGPKGNQSDRRQQEGKCPVHDFSSRDEVGQSRRKGKYDRQ